MIITLTVNNAAIPIIEDDIRLRDGMVFLNGTVDTVGLPWAFARTTKMMLDIGVPGAWFIGSGENSTILPVSSQFGPKVSWIDKTRLQVAGAIPGNYDFIVAYQDEGALVLREHVSLQGSSSLTFSPVRSRTHRAARRA